MDPNEPLTPEHARRLVACWNACRKLGTEDLERVAAYPTPVQRLASLSMLAEKVMRRAADGVQP